MRYIQPAGIALLACVALGTLLWSALVINDGAGGWFSFTGPFLFVYLLLIVCCCFSCIPLFRTCYLPVADAGPGARDRRLQRAGLATALSWLLLVLLTVFFVLLPLQLDNAAAMAAVSWGGVFGVLLATEIVLFLYVAATLALGCVGVGAGTGQLPLLYFCCVTDTDEQDDGDAAYRYAVPVCLGGGDTGTTPRSSPEKALLAYHVTLTVALGLAIVGTGLFLPFARDGSVSLPAALSLFWLGLAAVLVAGIVLLGVRVAATDTGTEARQTKWLLVATLVTLLVLVFAFQLLSAESFGNAHLLFAALYAAFGLLLIGACVVAAGDSVARQPGYRHPPVQPPTSSPPPGAGPASLAGPAATSQAGVQVNWGDLE